MQQQKTNNAKDNLKDMLSTYLESNPVLRTGGGQNEVEVRFGTLQGSSPISKIDYDNTVSQLIASGFKTQNISGIHLLRIQNEEIKTNCKKEIQGIKKTTRVSNLADIRTEIEGIDLIEEYCKTNSLQKILDLQSSQTANSYKIKFTRKVPTTKPVDFPDFNFRVSYQVEHDSTPASETGKNIINNWANHRKVYRYINRVRFFHDDIPIFADISIIKGNKKKGNVPIPDCSIQSAGVFESASKYEIELEIDNSKVGIGTQYNTAEKISKMIFSAVRIVLSALQRTNYPISYIERESVLRSYLDLIKFKDDPRNAKKYFIAPSSSTLQIVNVIPISAEVVSPNIRNNYTVTDKADGERRLLYVTDNGKIYMIDANMNVINTGAETKEKTLFNSILDGENIKYDKSGKYINLYAAFDIYFINKRNFREFAFMKIKGQEDEDNNKFRLLLLKNAVDKINIIGGDFTIKCKHFYQDSETETIFDGCFKILSNANSGIYEYNTDGLIFTPCNTGVGTSAPGPTNPSPLKKTTWDLSFKWKPPSYNTNDFLVSIKKDKNKSEDAIGHVFCEGDNNTGQEKITQYKTLVLRCGFNKKQHGFLNPFQSVLDDEMPSSNEREYDDSGTQYKPEPFIPTNPYDNNACFTNVFLSSSASGEKVLKTEEGEYFEEDMIVEFKYDLSLEEGWRWIPLRVRYDKTEELRSGIPNYGNAYHVANSNWHSIHNPITEEMLSTGRGIPETDIGSEDVYYNRKNINVKGKTNSLRNFHNLYVKNKLIVGVSNIGDSLIDYAVGKAGDLSKWISARLGFVLGIDVSKDNIYLNMDGACSRYLNEHMKTKKDFIPRCIFVNGNSTVNIRSGDALVTDKEKTITRAIFGEGPKDEKLIGKAVYRNYGIAKNGFKISSCQFAVHYFFESKRTLHAFLKNLSDCTAVNGYFIGTCYDGQSVFNLLKDREKGGSVVFYKSGNVTAGASESKICEIVKLYDQTGFPDNETSLGYSINVFQETINKYFREYLVPFSYFKQLLEDYGFILISKEEAIGMKLPESTGLFSSLFHQMENEIRVKANNYGDAPFMSPGEKQLSFLNRYFVFKKVRHVENKIIPQMNGDNETAELLKDVTDNIETIKENEFGNENVFVRKLKKRITLNKFSYMNDSPVVVEKKRKPKIRIIDEEADNAKGGSIKLDFDVI